MYSPTQEIINRDVIPFVQASVEKLISSMGEVRAAILLRRLLEKTEVKIDGNDLAILQPLRRAFEAPQFTVFRNHQDNYNYDEGYTRALMALEVLKRQQKLFREIAQSSNREMKEWQLRQLSWLPKWTKQHVGLMHKELIASKRRYNQERNEFLLSIAISLTMFFMLSEEKNRYELSFIIFVAANMRTIMTLLANTSIYYLQTFLAKNTDHHRFGVAYEMVVQGIDQVETEARLLKDMIPFKPIKLQKIEDEKHPLYASSNRYAFR